MNLDEELERIQRKKDEINQEKPEISSEAKANAIVNLAKEPENMVAVAVSNKVANKIENDEVIKGRIENTADTIVDSATETIENKAEANKTKSEQEKNLAYFNAHKEELKTAGIDEPTYMEDMERAVKWHKRWSNFHWRLVGWWMCGIRTFIQKAKPFRATLNIIATLLFVGVSTCGVWGIAELIQWIW